MFRCKSNERQRRDRHERDYEKYLSNLRQQSSHSNRFYLSNEYLAEIHRSQKRRSLQRQREYERIQRENDRLNERLRQVRGELITKKQHEKDWQRHVNQMKKTSIYPENIDWFVSNRRSFNI